MHQDVPECLEFLCKGTSKEPRSFLLQMRQMWRKSKGVVRRWNIPWIPQEISPSCPTSPCPCRNFKWKISKQNLAIFFLFPLFFFSHFISTLPFLTSFNDRVLLDKSQRNSLGIFANSTVSFFLSFLFFLSSSFSA